MAASDFPETARSPKVSHFSGLVELAEKLIKASTLLAVFGYMSLRAQINHLGIPLGSSPGVEAYLYETYSLVGHLMQVLFSGFIILLFMVVVILLGYLMFTLLAHFRKSDERAGKRSRISWMRRIRDSVWTPILSTSLVLVFYFITV